MIALAGNAEAVEPTPPTAEDARAFLRVDLARDVCNQTLTLPATNATLEDIASRVQKLLADSAISPKLRIEVRNAKPIRLSFAAKKSTVGDVLSSAATLAGAQLWIFSDHLLLAPKEALLPGELEALKHGSVIAAQGQQGQSAPEYSWMRNQQQQAAFSNFIASEMKALNVASDGNLPGANGIARAEPTTPLELIAAKTIAQATVGQLSPEAQAMLSELFDQSKREFSHSQNLAFANLLSLTLSSTNSVKLVAEHNNSVTIIVPGRQSWTIAMRWDLNGSGTGLTAWSSDPSQPTPSIPSPVDLSAGQS